jgi:hypothetical protein
MLFTIDSEARQLVGQMSASARQGFDEVIGKIKKLQSELIHVKTFVIEGHREREGERERAG